jgi:ABC-type multidrug transport system fused ATPase/permease subunit
MTKSFSLRTVRSFYNAFFKDAVRLLKTIPLGLKYRWWSVVSIQLVTGFLETLSLVCITMFALSITTPESVADNFLFKQLFVVFPSLREEILGSPRRIIALASFMMVLSIALKSSVSFLASFICSNFVERTVMFFSSETIRHHMDREYLWHITPESKEIVLKLINRHAFSGYLSKLLLFYSNALICLFLFSSLLLIEPGITLLAFAIILVSALLLYTFFRRTLDREGKNALNATTDGNRILMAIARGIREIIICRVQSFALLDFSKSVAQGVKSGVIINYLSLMPQQILEALGFITMAAMVIGMLAMNLPMEYIVQTTSLLMLTAWRLLPAVNRCLFYSIGVRAYRASVMEYFDIWDRFHTDGGQPLPDPDPDFRFTKFLAIHGASFRYPGATSDALSDISMTVSRGSRVGLVGASGSGKTTLALMLAGLAPPSTGEFLVDGKPLTPACREAYFRILGFVPQNPLILDGTLADNVAFGYGGSSRDETRVKRALRSAAVDFADPDLCGIDMKFSSSSPNLSGGQIQRVAIARALYSDPQVILFDEATSALDQTSENLILRTLEESGKDVTMIVIAHRLTSVEFCDTLYWLEGGRIVRSGPPSEIIPLYIKNVEQNGLELAGGVLAEVTKGGEPFSGGYKVL